MKPRPPRKPRVAVGIIERHDNHVLIVLPSTPDDQTRLWQFPRGLANIDESPEQAMRRIADEQLAIHVEIVGGQRPFAGRPPGLPRRERRRPAAGDDLARRARGRNALLFLRRRRRRTPPRTVCGNPLGHQGAPAGVRVRRSLQTRRRMAARIVARSIVAGRFLDSESCSTAAHRCVCSTAAPGRALHPAGGGWATLPAHPLYREDDIRRFRSGTSGASLMHVTRIRHASSITRPKLRTNLPRASPTSGKPFSSARACSQL